MGLKIRGNPPVEDQQIALYLRQANVLLRNGVDNLDLGSLFVGHMLHTVINNARGTGENVTDAIMLALQGAMRAIQRQRAEMKSMHDA